MRDRRVARDVWGVVDPLLHEGVVVVEDLVAVVGGDRRREGDRQASPEFPVSFQGSISKASTPG